MRCSLKGRDIISIQDLSKGEILHLIEMAKRLKTDPCFEPLFLGKILGNCFFEPSTRTRLSFASAFLRLGGQVIGFSDSLSISTKKGESLSDTMRVIDHYADVVVLRHSQNGAAKLAADQLSIPLINAGDGTNHHPTQTLVDLFSIQETQKKMENLSICLVGDLKHARTVHSLALALISFNSRLFFVSPQTLEMPGPICDELKKNGIHFSYHKSVEEVISHLDILYVTRIHEERFSDKSDYENHKNTFQINLSLLHNAKDNLKILHPLPRRCEIDVKLDVTPFAYYFEQAGNGIFTRQALLASILGTL